jgi:hypothetical protein
MEKDQYYTEDYFNTNLLKEILAEFIWPETFRLQDEGHVVQVIFPNCTINFESDGQGGVDLEFITYNKTEILEVSLPVILEVTNFNTSELDLEDRESTWPNLSDTKKSTRNNVKILQAFFLPFIKGDDYSWVEDAKNEKYI